MNVIVCVKQVPDPEGLSSSFLISAEMNRVEPSGIATVLNPFDENAIEAALKIKDANPDKVKVTILTLGYNISKALIIKSLATGADELFQIDDETFTSGNMDSHGTVHALACAIRKIGKFDLILMGRQSADLNAGQTAVGLGCELELPTITLAKSIEVHDEIILIERSLVNRRVKVKCPLPAVVMVNSDNGVIRYPTFPQILSSKKKPVTIWSARDIGFDTLKAQNRLVLRRLYKPEMPNRDCVIIRGASSEEAGQKLAEMLLKDHIL